MCVHAQLLQLCVTLSDPMECSPPGSFVHGILQTRVLEGIAMPLSRGFSWPRDWTLLSYDIQRSHLCHPLLLLTSIFPSIRVFSNKSVLRVKWAKYWSFNFSISPSDEYSGLISFRIDWFGFLEVQGTLKSLFQHHSSKASILQHSAFFMVQLSYPYMTTGKTIVLTIQTFVSKVMSLLFNMLFRFVISFLSRSKWLLISGLMEGVGNK